MAKPLEYELIEESFDDTTHIRTMTEQAVVPGRGWMIRTTLYTPHHISVDMAFIPDRKARGGLFEPIAP